jgi:phosphatidylglycerophosphatase A
LKINVFVFLSTFAFVGRFPFAPGTAGSFVGVLLAWPILMYFGVLGLVTAVIIIFIVGVWAVDIHQTHTGAHDAGEIVIDEVAGQWLVLLVASLDIVHFGLGFLLFRLFDIWKPWPICWVDRTLKGGFGVMADDIIAGIYALICLWALQQAGI